MRKKLAAPYIPKVEHTRAVMKLLAWGEGLIEIIRRQHEQELHLKDEVAVLKGEKKRPRFKPSRMHEEAGKKAGAPDRQRQTKPARRRGKPSPYERLLLGQSQHSGIVAGGAATSSFPVVRTGAAQM